MSDLYRELILEHWRSPQNFGKLKSPTHEAFQNNPLCGDEIGAQLLVNNDVIEDVRFDGRGCAISISAASLLTEYVKGKKAKEVLAMNEKTITDLLGVTPNPSRMKCAVLGLGTIQKALQGPAV